MRKSSIPTITSTGRNRVRNPSAPLSGLANISIGRYMSEIKKRNESEDKDSFDFSKFAKADYNQKSQNKPMSPIINDIDMIESAVTITENGKITVIIQFTGVEFSGSTIFDKINNTATTNSNMILHLSTTGDILDYSITRGDKNLYINELFIPKLMNKYNPLNMDVIFTDNSVIVTYNKLGQ